MRKQTEKELAEIANIIEKSKKRWSEVLKSTKGKAPTTLKDNHYLLNAQMTILISLHRIAAMPDLPFTIYEGCDKLWKEVRKHTPERFRPKHEDILKQDDLDYIHRYADWLEELNSFLEEVKKIKL